MDLGHHLRWRSDWGVTGIRSERRRSRDDDIHDGQALHDVIQQHYINDHDAADDNDGGPNDNVYHFGTQASRSSRAHHPSNQRLGRDGRLREWGEAPLLRRYDSHRSGDRSVEPQLWQWLLRRAAVLTEQLGRGWRDGFASGRNKGGTDRKG